MKKLVVIILFIVCVHAYELTGCTAARQEPIERVREKVGKGISQLEDHVANALLPAIQQKKDTATLRETFLQARLLYKQIEWAAEYFMPTTTRFVNGPPLPEIENEENKIMQPEGLQVIEAMIYTDEAIDERELERQAKLLISHCRKYSSYWESLEIDSSQVLDAIKLQVFRIETLGISGFDAPLAGSSLREAAASLRSLKDIAAMFFNDAQLIELFDNCIQYASAGSTFNDFNRLEFIKAYCNPLTSQLVQLQKQHSIPFVASRRLLRPSAETLFGKNVFDVNAYVQDSSYFTTAAKTDLGKKLFYDPQLSINNKISCSNCHNPAKGFADGLTANVSLSNTKLLRNTPGLLNAALQPWQFYDMRITNLENQSKDVIENKSEMHGSLSAAVKKLQNDNGYRNLFRQAFPNAEAISEKQVQNAIASYVRSLSLLNSRFDRYMQNEANVSLTPEEQNGFNLFMGKAKCGTCHFAPLFNGTVPPAFVKMESEVIGVPADKHGRQLDTDPGRFAIFALAPYRNAFKTTTVRNVALTAPYMHNGVFETLHEVMDFYDKGGGAGLGLDVPNQTLPTGKLRLTAGEKRSIIAFLKTLTDSIP
jgi:cytochrome c peroxidase